MENARTQISKSTSFTEINVYQYAENVGAKSQKKTWIGNNSTKFYHHFKWDDLAKKYVRIFNIIPQKRVKNL